MGHYFLNTVYQEYEFNIKFVKNRKKCLNDWNIFVITLKTFFLSPVCPFFWQFIYLYGIFFCVSVFLFFVCSCLICQVLCSCWQCVSLLFTIFFRIWTYCTKNSGGQDRDDILRHPGDTNHGHLLVQHRRRHGKGLQVRH